MLAAGLLGAGDSAAQIAFTPALERDFAPRRVAPPAAGRPRLPRAAAPPAQGEAERAQEAPEIAAFWAALEAGAPGPERLAAALGPARAATGEAAPARLAAVFRAHGRHIAAAARANRLSPALLAAVIAVESGGRADAVSPKGALGVMQLMPATAARAGVADPFAPEQAIRGGAAHLSALLAAHGEDAPLALAAWNAGAGAVARHGGPPPFAETRAFVPKVAAAFAAAATLCFPAPAAARDACTAPGALDRAPGVAVTRGSPPSSRGSRPR